MSSGTVQKLDWKAEVAAKRVQRERETDVERRWQEAMNGGGGKDTPDWLKETAMKRKAQLDKDTGVAPWMKEVQRTNAGLARRLSEAKQAGEETPAK